jgi:RimJ/RimL family protein N-acetyltransferase
LIDNTVPIAEFKHNVTLRDGSEITIRPLCHADIDKFLSMFNCLSKETKFLRYHFVKLHLSDKEAEESCSPDYTGKFALAAEKNGASKRIVGVARLDRIGSSSMAEIAFLVDDREQGRGICTHLLEDIVTLGRQVGIHKFFGLLTNENVIMLDILRKFAPYAEVKVEGSDIMATFEI